MKCSLPRTTSPPQYHFHELYSDLKKGNGQVFVENPCGSHVPWALKGHREREINGCYFYETGFLHNFLFLFHALAALCMAVYPGVFCSAGRYSVSEVVFGRSV